MSDQLPPIEEISPLDEFAIQHQSDWVLQALIGLINRNKWSFDFTLHIKGTVLTGTAIDGAEYFEGLGRAFNQGLKAAAVAAGIEYNDESGGRDMFKGVITDVYSSSEDQDDDSGSIVSFIHLKNVTIISPSNLSFSSKMAYWRIKISDVDGWMLGRGTRV